MNPNKLIPSMFHRRLVLLAMVFAAITLGLSAQLFRLSVVEGSTNRAVADSRLRLKSYLPQPRAEILDRFGRILARDAPSYDIAVNYQVIVDAWPTKKATNLAIRELGRSAWHGMNGQKRAEAIQQRRGQFEDQVQLLWESIRTLGHLSSTELDERCGAIKRRVETLAARVWDRSMMEQDHDEAEFESASEKPRPKIREELLAHVVLSRVPDEVAVEFQRLVSRWPGMLEVQDSTRREYPWLMQTLTLDRSTLPDPIRTAAPLEITVDGVADHILGRTREAWAEDLIRRPLEDPRTDDVDLAGYAPGDMVGSRGLEQVFEDQLRGTRGLIERRRDSGAEQRIERTPGTPLQTTIDIKLQARVQAILDPAFGLTRVHQWQAGWSEEGPKLMGLPAGTALNSAAVVLDVATGQILAMVSMPTMAMGQSMSEAQRLIDNPWVNRPVEAIYPPGSIIKPLVLAAAVTEGVQPLDGHIECNGHFFPERKDVFRCWIFREHYKFATHGSLDAVAALARSCNIYFYTMATRLGMSDLSRWYRAFGLGAPLDVGLLSHEDSSDPAGRWTGETAGDVPDEQDIARIGNSASETAAIGIGQGQVTWTPIQAANAYAILARRGVMRDPTLVKDDSRVRHAAPRADLNLSDLLIERTMEGLRQSVAETIGTGNHISYENGSTEPIINATGVTVWAKTGTAQAPPATIDGDGDGIAERKLVDPLHAWFVGLVGDSRTKKPQYAIAVIVEYGGSGGKTAGPVANQIIHALQDEGYLAGTGSEEDLPQRTQRTQRKDRN